MGHKLLGEVQPEYCDLPPVHAALKFCREGKDTRLLEWPTSRGQNLETTNYRVLGLVSPILTTETFHHDIMSNVHLDGEVNVQWLS